ncbi:MAG TPA: GDSL-type esterase/lipase family protein [Vicinamibacterales bacterium]|jgi:lysophospholipase L1-like esterase
MSPACSSPTQPTPSDPYPTGPKIACPAPPAVLTSPNNQPIPVQYGTATSTGGAPPVTITCAPASGSTFPIGTSTVVCTASDARARTDACNFSIVVQQPNDRISLTQFVAFGDSITWGEDGSPEVLCGSNNNVSVDALGRIYPLQRVATNQQYPAILAQSLQTRYPPQATTIGVANAGNPGEAVSVPPQAPSAAVLTRFQSAIVGMQAVLLMEGTNDIFYGDPTRVDPAIVGLNRLLAIAKGQGVRPFLATIPSEVPGGTRACGHLLVPTLNDKIRTLAFSAGVTLVDVNAGMGANFQQYIGPDGLHPNVLGYQKIAEIFFNVLTGTLTVPAVTTTTFAAPIPALPHSQALRRR